jgi:hypothetical protein
MDMSSPYTFCPSRTRARRRTTLDRDAMYRQKDSPQAACIERNFERRITMLVLKIALAAVLIEAIPRLIAAAFLWSLGAICRMVKMAPPNAPQSSPAR